MPLASRCLTRCKLVLDSAVRSPTTPLLLSRTRNLPHSPKLRSRNLVARKTGQYLLLHPFRTAKTCPLRSIYKRSSPRVQTMQHLSHRGILKRVPSSAVLARSMPTTPQRATRSLRNPSHRHRRSDELPMAASRLINPRGRIRLRCPQMINGVQRPLQASQLRILVSTMSNSVRQNFNRKRQRRPLQKLRRDQCLLL